MVEVQLFFLTNQHLRRLARVCGVPVCRHSGSRLAMTLVATINDIIVVFSFLFSVVYFSHRGSAGIKVDGSAQKPRGRHLSRPCWPFCGSLAAIFDFKGLAALQAVSECPLRR